MPFRFLSRTETFASHPFLARHAHDLQRALFNPDDNLYMEDDIVWLAGEASSRRIGADEAAALNAEQAAACLARHETFGPLPKGRGLPDLVAVPSGGTYVSLRKRLPRAFEKLWAAMGWADMALIAAIAEPFVRPEHANPSKHLADALRVLDAAGLPEGYCGGICGPVADVAPLVDAMLWLERTNAGTGMTLIAAPQASSVFVTCKYMNFHIACYDAGERALLQQALVSAGLQAGTQDLCFNRFSRSSRIAGRQLKVG
ncbi:MAG TPA: hypothetical protein PKE65_05210 [Rhizobiaceae bacterium]|nr:hypothetical protein [Rhizobiaceae bacterium]